MLGVVDLGTYIIGTIAIIMLPGPNSMYCLSIAGQHGAKVAYRSIAGILLGDSVLMLATALGAGSLLKTQPQWFNAMKLIGGLYLAYIGIQLLRGAWAKWHTKERLPEKQTLSSKHIFKHALMLSLVNPKAILFFLSFFVQFVAPDYDKPWLSFLILALILQAVSFIYLNILAFAGQGLVRMFKQHKVIASSGMGLVGLMFVGFALKLWVAEV